MAKKISKKTEISSAEQEKLKILSKANETKGEQLSIAPDGEIASKKEIKNFALGNIENPERKYEVYYKGINKLLRKHLPKGKENKKARDYIYEEKNVYLTRGKRKNQFGIRGADGRMGYSTDGEEVLKIVIDWVFSQDTPVNLYTKMRDINIKKGYGTRTF